MRPPEHACIVCVHMCVGADVVNTDDLYAGSAPTCMEVVTPHRNGCSPLKNFPDINDDASTNYSARPVSYILTK